MRELHVLQLQSFQGIGVRCFGLHIGDGGNVSVRQGETMDDVGNIAVLDEELQQSDRYMNTEMGLNLTTSACGIEE